MDASFAPTVIAQYSPPPQVSVPGTSHDPVALMFLFVLVLVFCAIAVVIFLIAITLFRALGFRAEQVTPICFVLAVGGAIAVLYVSWEPLLPLLRVVSEAAWLLIAGFFALLLVAGFIGAIAQDSESRMGCGTIVLTAIATFFIGLVTTWGFWPRLGVGFLVAIVTVVLIEAVIEAVKSVFRALRRARHRW